MEMPRGGWDMKIGSAARFQIEPRVNVVDLCKQARNDMLKRCRAGGFLRMNFRYTEFTLSASSATISKTTRAVMSRSASIDHFELARPAFAKLHCRPRSGSAWPRLGLR
jgi:hypothetical protein